jgi:hypothetical protein
VDYGLPGTRARPLGNSPRRAPQKRAPAKSRHRVLAFKLTRDARHIIALARDAEARERASGNSLHAYHLRRRREQLISALAERIAERPLACGDDLLTLALAGWYAAGARHTLVKAILRAGGIDPRAPHARRRR